MAPFGDGRTPDHIVPLGDIEAAGERWPAWCTGPRCSVCATAATWTTVAIGVRLAGDRLYLKAEHLQKTGSFKARGMTNGS